MLFGDKSEKRTRDAESAQGKDKSGHGPTPQPFLPEIMVVHEIDVADAVCSSSCGGQLTEWEGQTEDSLRSGA